MECIKSKEKVSQKVLYKGWFLVRMMLVRGFTLVMNCKYVNMVLNVHRNHKANELFVLELFIAVYFNLKKESAMNL